MSFLAFLIGSAVLLLFYYFLSIPILPCISVFLTLYLFLKSDKGFFSRIIFSLIVAIGGFLLYLLNAIAMIQVYPNGGNVLAIVFEFITAACFLFSGFSIIPISFRYIAAKKEASREPFYDYDKNDEL